jgi:hypothetical protein
MSDGIEKAHADAVLNLLHAALDSVPIAVYDGKVPDPTPDVDAHPWLLVYLQGEWPLTGTANALDGQSVTYLLRIYCHAVGGTAAAARAVAGMARAVLLNARPTVSGRTPGLIRWSDGQPPNPDESLGHLVMDKIDVYELITTPG